ncbi:MAG: FtsX-like permease family protein [Acidimicrobiales bacterium]
MIRISLRSFWDHKRRLISTIVAIVLGVAFMAGTFVLTDTLDKVFDDLFAEVSDKIDTQVQGEVLFSDPFGGDQRALLDAGLVETVAAVDGVAGIAPAVGTIGFGSTNRILDADGKAIGASQGPPTLIESWTTDPDLTAYVVADGRGPVADDELALNVAAIEEGGFALGDRVTMVNQFGREEFTLVGAVTFGSAKSSAGATSVELTLAQAQRLAGTDGKVQQILARAADGIDEAELTRRIAAVLPPNAEAITGTEAGAQLSKSVQSGFSFFKVILSVFGGVALLVGIFVISNTFSILVAQRTRELALLRAIGASRSQVLRSVLFEATFVGLLAAGLGLVAGVGLAKGVTAVLDATGADLPTTTLQVRSSTVIAALVIGLVVTLVAALIPAIRATRVPPIAALREVAIDRSNASKVRIGLGVTVALLGAVFLSAAWTDGSSDALPTVGMGAILLIVGAILSGPVLSGPSVLALGAPLPKLNGVTGKLASQNAARSPKRTSATASALIIGVALVGFITVFAASATSSVTSEVERGFKGDFVIQSTAGAFGPPSGFPGAVADTAAAVDGVEVVVPLGFGRGEFTYPDGKKATQFLTSVEPAGLDQVLEPRMTDGSMTDLRDDGIVVDKELAEAHDVRIGDSIAVTVAGGEAFELTVQAISDDRSLLGWFTVTRETYKAAVPELLDVQVFGKIAPGANLPTVISGLETALQDTPSIEVLDRDGFIGALASQITSFVTFIYGLLILSILIALIGIANTLSLSINERTRELGLLRAVGMHRAQLRATVRWEAVLISVLGTLVGLSLGLVISWALIEALSSQGLTVFTMPIGALAVITVLAALFGTAASILPARRAARLNILEAISYE